MDKMIDTDGKYAAKVVTDVGFIPKREDLIQRGALLDAYDAAHKGPPGGARMLIATAPAVNAVPVIHGRWTYFNCVGNGRYQCSECQHWVDAGADRNYCPHCGAVMDGDESDASVPAQQM